MTADVLRYIYVCFYSSFQGKTSFCLKKVSFKSNVFTHYTEIKNDYITMATNIYLALQLYYTAIKEESREEFTAIKERIHYFTYIHTISCFILSQW